jgi:hypothetical protein
MNRERLVHTALEIAATASVAFLLTNAFSKKTRREIWERAGGVSELSGEGGRVECAHYNHDRSGPAYDDPNNGLLVTIYEHLHSDEVGHVPQRQYYPQDPLPNGLKPEWNEWAIKKIEERLPKQELRQMSLDEFNDALFG